MAKKRTILLSEDLSEVSPPSLDSKAKSFASIIRKTIHPVRGGFESTLLSFGRKGKSKGRVVLGIGYSPKDKSPAKSRGKSHLGFKIEVKF